MKPAVVAAIQPRWKRYTREETLRTDFARFLRLARDKGANIAVFPEYSGLMLAGPLAEQKKQALVRRGGIFSRVVGALGGSPELANAMPVLINEYGDDLIARYHELWSELAREYNMLVVGGTILTRDEDGGMRSRAGVFAANGDFLGWQPRLHVGNEEQNMLVPGEELAPFETSFGRIGVLVGHDILFPELARALAYQGIVGILCPTLARSREGWERQRLVALARAQENQIYVALSHLVGENDIFVGAKQPFAGRSAVFAPVELTPRRNGVLGQVGAEKVEGVVTGEWNIAALQNLWGSAEVAVREIARGSLFHNLLTSYYQDQVTIAERTEELLALPAPEEEVVVEEPPVEELIIDEGAEDEHEVEQPTIIEEIELPDWLDDDEEEYEVVDEEEYEVVDGEVDEEDEWSPGLDDTEPAPALNGDEEPYLWQDEIRRIAEQSGMSVEATVEEDTIIDGSTNDGEATGQEEGTDRNAVDTPHSSTPIFDPETGEYLGEKPADS